MNLSALNTKQCPKCHTDNPALARFCRHCRYEFPEATITVGSLSPEIKSFKIREDKYWKGSVVHIDWKVDNANIVMINDVDVTSMSDFEITVDSATTLTISAENDYDKASKSLRLSPHSLPSITSFSSSQRSISSNQEIKLKWSIRNFARAVLRYGSEEIDVTHKDYFKHRPDKDITYTLVCFAEDERFYEEQSIDVHVMLPVKIKFFEANKDYIVESDKVVLTWDVENADSVILYPFARDISSLNKYEVAPSRTTEYRLEARNMISKEEAVVAVGVRTLPKIDVEFADAISKIELPSCNVDLSFISSSMEKSKIDEWMTITPLEDISRLNFKYKIKAFSAALRKMFIKR